MQALIFPGIGYHCDKPLLYYTRKLLQRADVAIENIDYGLLPRDDKKKAFDIALAAAGEQAARIQMNAEKYFFESKSIGTGTASAIAEEQAFSENIFHIYFTPPADMVPYLMKNSVVFAGTADPLFPNIEILEKECRKKGILLYLYEGANHSLEVPDVKKSLEILSDVAVKAD